MAENRSDDSPVVHQALYRRYRPQRFADLVGQEHVSEPLKAAVRDGRVTHAYLFSGPRGTGKTTTARILAMALNCQQPSDGEPCGECESCQSIRNGTSMDVIELDAASNRKLDDIRDIIRSASLATAGHWRVFILDEVHQLDRHAVPALLKTLEEPPPHVVFVLATTDPQEVLPTVRSRTQHFEFRLLPNEVLRQLVDDVCGAADIELDDASRDVVVRRGRGSARDALSALDQVAALGQVSEDDTAHAMNIVRACSLHAADAALTGLANAFAAGRSARALGEEIVRVLRQALLCGVAPSAADVSEEEMLVYKQFVDGLTLAGVTRAIELVGVALSEMREALDQRIPLEVAIVRVCRAGADDLASLEARVAVLESGGVVVVNAQQAASVADTAGTQTEVDEPPRNPGASTATLDDVRKELRKSVDTPTRTSTPQRALPAKDSLEPTGAHKQRVPPRQHWVLPRRTLSPRCESLKQHQSHRRRAHQSLAQCHLVRP